VQRTCGLAPPEPADAWRVIKPRNGVAKAGG